MRSRVRLRNGHEEENFWPSFTDLISTIALILFFLILIIFIENIIIAENLNNEQQKLISTESALLQKEEEMAILNAEISDQETNLMLLKQEAEDLKLEVDQGELALKLSEDQILEQQMIIATSNKELGDMRSQIRSIAVIRLSILERVKEAIEDEMNASGIDSDGGQVLIGDNGNIILNNTLLFDSNSSVIGGDGEVLLSELATVFEKILDDREIRNYIDAIQIEGHTDSVNTSEYNRNLSAERAISVVNHIFETNPGLERKYGPYFVASAFSEYRPLVPGETAYAKSKNRRIEISIILKDSNIQEIIDDYLQNITDIDPGISVSSDSLF